MPFSYGDMPKILMFGYNSPTKQPYLAQFPVDIKLEPSQSYFCDSPFVSDHWRWGESNPRPNVPPDGVYKLSRCSLFRYGSDQQPSLPYLSRLDCPP